MSNWKDYCFFTSLSLLEEGNGISVSKLCSFTVTLQWTLLLKLYRAVMKCFRIILCTIQYCALLIVITVCTVPYCIPLIIYVCTVQYVPSLLFCAQCSTVPSSLLLLYAQFITLPPHYCSVHNKVLCPHYLCTRAQVWHLEAGFYSFVTFLMTRTAYVMSKYIYIYIHIYIYIQSYSKWLSGF